MNFKVLQGVFPVFKPFGITSSQLLEVIKAKLKSEFHNDSPIKMGHGGTLDKSATGVLVVGINSGCTQLPAFLGGDKEYHTCCVFGKATDTYNSEGQMTMEKSYDHIKVADIISFANAIKGQILQKPPPYSALKFEGKRLSDLVREGKLVDPDPRLVDCYDFKVVEFLPPTLTFDVTCGRGFYIRSLVHDLGISLDSCAHVNALERTRQGPFSIQDCLKQDECNVSEIHDKIIKMQCKLDEYLDIQMNKYRKLKNKNASKVMTHHAKRKKKVTAENPSDQWNFAK